MFTKPALPLISLRMKMDWYVPYLYLKTTFWLLYMFVFCDIYIRYCRSRLKLEVINYDLFEHSDIGISHFMYIFKYERMQADLLTMKNPTRESINDLLNSFHTQVSLLHKPKFACQLWMLHKHLKLALAGVLSCLAESWWWIFILVMILFCPCYREAGR